MTTRRQTLGLLAAAALLPIAPRFAFSAAPFSNVANAGYYRFHFGNFEVTGLSDGTMALPMAKIYQNEPIGALQRKLDENFLGKEPHISINAYLVNDGERLVLIDAGTGTLFGPGAGKLIQHLERSGYRADQVDAVILTHIHADHSGGLTVDGKTQFPNATIHVADREYRFWINREGLTSVTEEIGKDLQRALDALAPYIATGKVARFADDADPLPNFGSILRPGHTPGHSSIVLKGNDGQRLVFWGDVIHGDYVQFDEPDVFVTFDVDGTAAAATRAVALADAADGRYLVAGAHLPFPGIGHVARDTTLYRFIPWNYVE
ncbi:MBL fold metallo-hydrolase [Rhizobium mulingense]|uniref:MBL fold metallo-hydrolase n=1 Tax=Rhizobium mulingense TaxID=3031128 RepID=UPI002B4A0716|nr:MBL fold metallo-hydrolase [Rhizobium sp. MJ21]MEB3042209.1 MBL fold metallo-hydrolase [Rhizobium sp. MJ21]